MDSAAHKDEVFLNDVVRAIVAHPEDVKITRTVDEMGALLTLDVHPEDMGKIIGRMGTTAKAIRTLLRVVDMSDGARTNLKITDPNPGMRGKAHNQEDGGFDDIKG